MVSLKQGTRSFIDYVIQFSNIAADSGEESIGADRYLFKWLKDHLVLLHLSVDLVALIIWLQK